VEAVLEGIDDQLARRVGAITMAMLLLAVLFFVFVYGRLEWGHRTRIRVYFHHAGALHEGAPLVVAGRAVGEIESIALSPRGALGPLGGDEGVVVVIVLDAREAARLDRAGDVFVASRGVLAERYLELGPPPDAKAGTMLREGEQLLGADPPSLDRVLQRTWDNLDGFASFAAHIRPELVALRARLAELASHLDPSSTTAVAHADMIAPMFAELAELRAQLSVLRERSLGGDVGMAHLGEVIAATEVLAARARQTLQELGASIDALRASAEHVRDRLDRRGSELLTTLEVAIDRIHADIAKLHPLLAQIALVRTTIERGDGSLLKIMRDPEFPEDTKDLGKIMKRHPWRILLH
jgi:hypothetical protein